MGVDASTELNQYLSRQSVLLHDPNKIICALALQFFGTRGLRYWLLTNAALSQRKSRPRLDKKDGVGVSIYKCKYAIQDVTRFYAYSQYI